MAVNDSQKRAGLERQGLLRPKRLEINLSKAKNEPLLSLTYLSGLISSLKNALTLSGSSEVENPAPDTIQFIAGSRTLNNSTFNLDYADSKQEVINDSNAIAILQSRLFPDDVINVLAYSRVWLYQQFNSSGVSFSWTIDADALANTYRQRVEEKESVSGFLSTNPIADFSLGQLKDAVEELELAILAVLQSLGDNLEADSVDSVLNSIRQDPIEAWKTTVYRIAVELKNATVGQQLIITPDLNLTISDVRKVFTLLYQETKKYIAQPLKATKLSSEVTFQFQSQKSQVTFSDSQTQEVVTYQDQETARAALELYRKIVKDLEKKVAPIPIVSEAEPEEESTEGGVDEQEEQLPTTLTIHEIINQLRSQVTLLFEEKIPNQFSLDILTPAQRAEFFAEARSLIDDYFRTYNSDFEIQLDQFLLDRGVQKTNQPETDVTVYQLDSSRATQLLAPLADHYLDEVLKNYQKQFDLLFEALEDEKPAQDQPGEKTTQLDKTTAQEDFAPPIPQSQQITTGLTPQIRALVADYLQAQNLNQTQVGIKASLLNDSQKEVLTTVHRELFAIIPFELASRELQQLSLEIAVSYALKYNSSSRVNRSQLLLEIFAQNDQYRRLVQDFYQEKLNEILKNANIDSNTRASIQEFLLTSTIFSDDWILADNNNDGLTDDQIRNFLNVSGVNRQEFLTVLRVGLYLQRYSNFNANLPYQGKIDSELLKDKRGRTDDSIFRRAHLITVRVVAPDSQDPDKTERVGLLALAGDQNQVRAREEQYQQVIYDIRKAMLYEMWEAVGQQYDQEFQAALFEYYFPKEVLPITLTTESGALNAEAVNQIATNWNLAQMMSDIQNVNVVAGVDKSDAAQKQQLNNLAKILLKTAMKTGLVAELGPLAGVASDLIVEQALPRLKKAADNIKKVILPILAAGLLIVLRFPVFVGALALGVALSAIFPALAPLIMTTATVGGAIGQFAYHNTKGLFDWLNTTGENIGEFFRGGATRGQAVASATDQAVAKTASNALPAITPTIAAAGAGVLVTATTMLAPGAFLHQLDYSASIIPTYGLCWPTTGIITVYKRYTGGAPHAVYRGNGPNPGDAVDIANSERKSGDPIYTPFSGEVIDAGRGYQGLYLYGNLVRIRVDETINGHTGFTVIFAHLDKVASIKSGDHIEKGTQIGTMGSTGNSSAPHLHYEVVYEDYSKLITIPEVVPPDPQIQLSTNGYLLNSPVITKRCVGSYLAQNVSTLSCQNPITIMPVGDSITVGVGASNQGGYRGPLYEKLISLGHTNVEFVGLSTEGLAIPEGDGEIKNHEGYGNYSPADLIPKTAAGINQLKPDIVLLHAGTVGICFDSPNNHAAKVLDLAQNAENQGSYVFVAKIFTSGNCAEESDQVYEDFNNALVAEYQRRQEEGFLQNTAIIDMSNVVDPKTDFSEKDSVHPTAQGYNKMSEAWYNQALVDLPTCN